MVQNVESLVLCEAWLISKAVGLTALPPPSDVLLTLTCACWLVDRPPVIPSGAAGARRTRQQVKRACRKRSTAEIIFSDQSVTMSIHRLLPRFTRIDEVV